MTGAAPVPDDPFAGATVVHDGQAKEPPAPDSAAGITRTIGGNPLVSIPLAILNRAAQTGKDVAVGAADAASNVIPGAFQRADQIARDPFGAAQVVVNNAAALGQSAQAADEGIGGGLLVGSPQEPAKPMKRRAMSLLGMADNLRTGVQRGIAADAAAPVSVVDLLHRGLFYGSQAAYNLTPPMRFDLGTYLDRTFNPKAGYDALNKIEPSHHIVNAGGSNIGMRGFGAGAGWYNPNYGRPPDPWLESYDEATHRKDANGAPSLWRSPLHTGDWPGTEVNLSSLAASPDEGETGWASGLLPKPPPPASPIMLNIPQHEGGAPDAASITRGVDSAVEGAGTLFNSASDALAQGTGKQRGPHVDLSPHQPVNGAEQYTQELAAGTVSPGKLLNRMMVAGASARVGQIPGIEGTGYELPLRIAATQVAGFPFAYKAGVPGDTGRALRRNVEDLGEYTVPTKRNPFWPDWVHRGRLPSPAPIPGTAEAALLGMEGQQKALNALGLSVLPAEIAQAGRGDVPRIVSLTNAIAGTPGGQPIRTALSKRPEQMQGAVGKVLEDTVGPRPADPATASGNVAAAAQAETQAANAAAEANTQQAFQTVKSQSVERAPVQALIDRLDEAIDAPSTHPMVAKEIGRFRDMLLDTRNTPAGEPITNVGQLDSVLRHYKDRVKLPPDAAEAIPGPAQKPITDFGDNLQGILHGHPGYAAAAAQEAAGDAAAMATTKGRVGAIGNAQQPQNARPVTAAGTARSLMLNPENSSPAAIAEAAQALNKQDPAAWRGIVSDWLHRETAKAYGSGTDPEMGAKLAARVFGDPDRKAILKTALEHVIGPDGQPLSAAQVDKVVTMMSGLENTDALSRAAAKGKGDQSIDKPPGMTRAFLSGIVHSIPGVRDVASSYSLGQASKMNTNLGTVLGAPDGISQILDLAYRTPRIKRGKATTAMLLNDTRNVARSIMFGNGGGLPLASPLLDGGEGGGGDTPKPPGPLRVEIRPPSFNP